MAPPQLFVLHFLVSLLENGFLFLKLDFLPLWFVRSFRATAEKSSSRFLLLSCSNPQLRGPHGASTFAEIVGKLCRKRVEYASLAVKTFVLADIQQPSLQNHKSLAICWRAMADGQSEEQLGLILQELSADSASRPQLLHFLKRLLQSAAIGGELSVSATCTALLSPWPDMQSQPIEVKQSWLMQVAELVCFLLQFGASQTRNPELEPRKKRQIFLDLAKQQMEAMAWTTDVFAEYLPRNECKSLFPAVVRRLLLVTAEEDSASETNKDGGGLGLDETGLIVFPETLARLILMGVSDEYPLSPEDSLKFLKTLIFRGARCHKLYHDSLAADNVQLVSAILKLASAEEEKEEGEEKEGNVQDLAVSPSYWEAHILVVVIGSLNPASIGRFLWDNVPIGRQLMERLLQSSFLPGTDDTRAGGLRVPLHVCEEVQRLDESLGLGSELRQSVDPNFFSSLIGSQSFTEAWDWLKGILPREPSVLQSLPDTWQCTALMLHEGRPSTRPALPPGALADLRQRLRASFLLPPSPEAEEEGEEEEGDEKGGLSAFLFFARHLAARNSSRRRTARACLQRILLQGPETDLPDGSAAGGGGQVATGDWLAVVEGAPAGRRLVGALAPAVVAALDWETDVAVVAAYLQFLHRNVPEASSACLRLLQRRPLLAANLLAPPVDLPLAPSSAEVVLESLLTEASRAPFRGTGELMEAVSLVSLGVRRGGVGGLPEGSRVRELYEGALEHLFVANGSGNGKVAEGFVEREGFAAAGEGEGGGTEALTADEMETEPGREIGSDGPDLTPKSEAWDALTEAQALRLVRGGDGRLVWTGLQKLRFESIMDLCCNGNNLLHSAKRSLLQWLDCTVKRSPWKEEMEEIMFPGSLKWQAMKAAVHELRKLPESLNNGAGFLSWLAAKEEEGEAGVAGRKMAGVQTEEEEVEEEEEEELGHAGKRRRSDGGEEVREEGKEEREEGEEEMEEEEEGKGGKQEGGGSEALQNKKGTVPGQLPAGVPALAALLRERADLALRRCLSAEEASRNFPAAEAAGGKSENCEAVAETPAEGDEMSGLLPDASPRLAAESLLRLHLFRKLPEQRDALLPFSGSFRKLLESLGAVGEGNEPISAFVEEVLSWADAPGGAFPMAEGSGKLPPSWVCLVTLQRAAEKFLETSGGQMGGRGEGGGLLPRPSPASTLALRSGVTAGGADVASLAVLQLARVQPSLCPPATRSDGQSEGSELFWAHVGPAASDLLLELYAFRPFLVGAVLGGADETKLRAVRGVWLDGQLAPLQDSSVALKIHTLLHSVVDPNDKKSGAAFDFLRAFSLLHPSHVANHVPAFALHLSEISASVKKAEPDAKQTIATAFSRAFTLFEALCCFLLENYNSTPPPVPDGDKSPLQSILAVGFDLMQDLTIHDAPLFVGSFLEPFCRLLGRCLASGENSRALVFAGKAVLEDSLTSFRGFKKLGILVASLEREGREEGEEGKEVWGKVRVTVPVEEVEKTGQKLTRLAEKMSSRKRRLAAELEDDKNEEAEGEEVSNYDQLFECLQDVDKASERMPDILPQLASSLLAVCKIKDRKARKAGFKLLERLCSHFEAQGSRKQIGEMLYSQMEALEAWERREAARQVIIFFHHLPNFQGKLFVKLLTVGDKSFYPASELTRNLRQIFCDTVGT